MRVVNKPKTNCKNIRGPQSTGSGFGNTYLVCLSGSSDDSGESALGRDFGLHLGLELAGGAREGWEAGQAQLKAG